MLRWKRKRPILKSSITDQESAIDMAERIEGLDTSELHGRQPFTDQESTVDIAEMEESAIEITEIKLHMEEKGVDSEKSKPSTSGPLSPPWLDLPDLATELILQHLPLPDYIRFADVCIKWQSIHNNHRRRHFPSQPPMSSPLPWLIPAFPYNDSNNEDLSDEDSNLHFACYSPFDDSFHRLQNFAYDICQCIFSCHGWILYVGSDTPFLLNPITTTSIGLAYLNLSEKFASLGSGAMSAPPSDPKCTFLLIDEDVAILCRVEDDHWARLNLPVPEKSPRSSIMGSTAVFSGGRFYCISSKCCFYVIDPALPQPLVRHFKMNTDEIPREHWANFLVESDGEVLLAVTLCDPSHPDREVLSGFQVFRPCYSENKWVRVRSIGDRALFIHQFCCFSLSASDVGCKKNCIYHPNSETDFAEPGDLFVVFDLETERWIDERPHHDPETKVDFSQFKKFEGIWFLPRLDFPSQ